MKTYIPENLWLIVLLIIDRSTGESFNQPTFCASALWQQDGVTFADQSTIGDSPNTIFVSVNNSIYVTEGNLSQVQMWTEGSSNPLRTISNGLMNPYGLFVSKHGDIYVDNGAASGQVEKWTQNAVTGVPVMNVSGICHSLFIDTSNNLYCCMADLNQVVKTSLNNGSNLVTSIAGNQMAGSASNMLNDPHGIYVDTDLNLYVADSGNNRIQLFHSNQLNGITVAGATAVITLNYPTAIILDASGYLFIADTNNDRIIRVDPTGFRCVVGCTGFNGSASDQLNKPWSLSFDSAGNLFVIDRENARIQKFILETNSCGRSYNQPMFCASATWNPNAVTLTDSNLVDSGPTSVFVSTDNTAYVIDTNLNEVQVWLAGSSRPTRNISADLNSTYAVFASIVGDVYFDNGIVAGQVDRWTLNATSSIVELYVEGPYYGLFIDIMDNLYCSMQFEHQVVKQAINNDVNTSIVIAGIGISGSGSNMLNEPRGIFVDSAFNLYVADCRNNRIQRFSIGQLNGVTVAGPGTVALSCPTGLVLDIQGYLFITDYDHHRVIGSGPNGFRCIVGCTSISGSLSNELYHPSSPSFDSSGNLFVADVGNNRIQKFLLAINTCGISYNQPQFCATTTWNTNATTIADNNTAVIHPYGLYVNTNNTLYVVDRFDNDVQIWQQGNTTPTSHFSTGSSNSFAIFITITGDVYIDNGADHGRVDQWMPNATNSTVAMYVDDSCYGLFVDIYGNLYCSLGNLHMVIKHSFNDDANTSSILAGNGTNGSESNMLNEPRGIFVTIKFSLYVADSGNHRIQLFPPNQLTGITVVGNLATIILDYPTDVVLDRQGYLFIADSNNHRIVGSGLNGFRCIAGCSGSSGSGSDQLSFPTSLSFDSFGNLFVTDSSNDRVQKFALAVNTCGRSYNLPKFCTYATWNPNGVTFADNSTISVNPSDVFIDVYNNIYVAETDLNQVQVWPGGSNILTRIIAAGLNSPYAVCTSFIGDIYVDNGAVNGRVDRWTPNASLGITAMYINESCYDLFLDIYDNLFCSLNSLHLVMRKSFNDNDNISMIVAGNGVNGSGVYLLNEPRGIFVDIGFNLYVADCGNNRIQLFQTGQLNGTTVLGSALAGPSVLSCPTGIVLDADGNLFVTDSDNNRVVASGPNGFRCIVGCSGQGSSSNELYGPQSLSFDTSGNIFVVDTNNNRIQKFLLDTNSCYSTTTITSTSTTTTTTSTSTTTTTTTSTTKTKTSTSTISTSTTSTSEKTSTTTTTKNIATITMAISVDSSRINTHWTRSIESSLATISPLHSTQQTATFNPSVCPTSSLVGSSCNISSDPCDIFQPCQNSGTCVNNNAALYGYVCSCLSGITGTNCQYDNRVCRPDSCWNNGVCNKSFVCQCLSGWEGDRCQTKINYCENIVCLNKGVCQPTLLNYTCQCLGDSYSGQHCQITSNRVRVLQIVSRSFGYVAILALSIVAMFIVVMDVLKYCFRIDFTSAHRPFRRRRRRRCVKKAKPISIRRYIYVHAPSILTEETTL